MDRKVTISEPHLIKQEPRLLKIPETRSPQSPRRI